MENMDPNAMVRALEKLLDYTASGIGAVAGPMLATWRAGGRRRPSRSLPKAKRTRFASSLLPKRKPVILWCPPRPTCGAR